MVKKCFWVSCDSDLHSSGMAGSDIPSTTVISGDWREAMKALREQGWMITNDGRHYCPECCKAENASKYFLKSVRGKSKAFILNNGNSKTDDRKA